MSGDILAADLLMRIGVDASGAAAEVTAKMTAAERAAVASGDRLAAGISRGADKATAAQLRVVSATEKYQKVLQSEKATLGQRAAAQASLITSQQRLNAELSKTERQTVAVGTAEKNRLGFLKTTLAAGAGVTGVQVLLNTVKQAKDAAIAYQDVVAANDVTFGKQRVQLEKFKATQAGQLNLSPLAVEESANLFGSVFKSAGSSQADALTQGLELTSRSADVRSFRGGRLQDVQDAFRSALVGETEPIRRYGVLLDDARLRLRALDLGLVKSTKETLPPAIKAQAAYAEIMAQTSDAAGDVARTSDSAANKIEDQREKADKAKLALGEGLLPVISELATVGAEVAPALAGVARGVSAILSNDLARRALLFGTAAAGIVKLTGALGDFASKTAGKITGNVALARSYDAVATSAGRAAVAEGSALGGGRGRLRPGRAQLAVLGGLVGVAGATGAVGQASGSGFLNGAANVAGFTAAGAGLGSFFPGPGTAIGAGAGLLVGLGAAAFGGDGTSPTASGRSVSAIKADIARADNELRALRASDGQGVGVDDLGRAQGLSARRNRLADELKAAAKAAKQTTPVFDQAKGTFTNMTKAQLEAATAAEKHKAALQAEKEEFEKLRESFAVPLFSGKRDTSKAVSAEKALQLARGTVSDQKQLRKDFATLAGRGASREALDELRVLEQQVPGTVGRIANASGKRYVREFDRALRQLSAEKTAFAKLFDGTDTLAAEKGKRDARAYARAHAQELERRAIWIASGLQAGLDAALPPGATTRSRTRYETTTRRNLTRYS